MFTGIVQGTAEVTAIDHDVQFLHLTVLLPEGLEEGLETGASVAHNGCCLTLTALNGRHAEFDIIAQTLAMTNLGALVVGDHVNIERAARFGDEIGGHLMSGHISGQAVIEEINDAENNRRLWFRLPPELVPFVLDKGFVGVEGASLTVSGLREGGFSVDLIPETLSRTTIGKRRIGDSVNIEIDPQTQAIVTTVERILARKG